MTGRRNIAGPRPDSTIRSTMPKARSGEQLDSSRRAVMAAIVRVRAAQQQLDMFQAIERRHGVGVSGREAFEARLAALRSDVEKAEAGLARAQRTASKPASLH